MRMKSMKTYRSAAALLALALTAVEIVGSAVPVLSLVNTAEARIGAPGRRAAPQALLAAPPHGGC